MFATTNKTGEGVGDMLPHMHVTVSSQFKSVRVLTWKLSTSVSMTDGITRLGCINDNPQLCQSYEDVKDPSENLLSFTRRRNVPRSLHQDLYTRVRHSQAAGTP